MAKKRKGNKKRKNNAYFQARKKLKKQIKVRKARKDRVKSIIANNKNDSQFWEIYQDLQAQTDEAQLFDPGSEIANQTYENNFEKANSLYSEKMVSAKI